MTVIWPLKSDIGCHCLLNPCHLMLERVASPSSEQSGHVLIPCDHLELLTRGRVMLGLTCDAVHELISRLQGALHAAAAIQCVP